jgi:hypothetical protein
MFNYTLSKLDIIEFLMPSLTDILCTQINRLVNNYDDGAYFFVCLVVCFEEVF